MINVTKSFLGDKAKLQAYIDEIYASGHLTNHGPLVTRLEERLQDYLSVRNIVLTGNGTLALQVAFRALGIQGSAITTPFSFVATSSALHWEGIRPLFADIDPLTWNLDPARIESRLASDTTGIVATHVFGNPCDIEGIQAIAERRGLKTVYDGAHAFGSRFRERFVGNWGDICTLSFHATKLFHTIEGGAIITNDDDLAARVRLLCNFGIVDTDCIGGPGINAKLNEFSAAMGLCVLDDIDSILAQRADIGQRYEAAFAGYLDMQKVQPGSVRNYSYFPVALEDESQLLRVRERLNRQAINPRRYFYPSLDTLDYLQPQQPQWISRDLSSRVLCLPIYPGLPRSAQDRVVDTLLQELNAGRAEHCESGRNEPQGEPELLFANPVGNLYAD